MRFVFLILFLLDTAALAQRPAATAGAIKALETRIERERLDAGIPGLSIAIVDDQKVIWAAGFGHADLEKKKAATPETVYRVGSVSKLFTDIAIMQLVEEGKIDLDVPVAKYLAEFKPSGPNAQKITLRMMMSHRSGLMREPPLGSYFDPTPPSLEKTIESLNGLPLIYEPGERTKYSNAAIAAVGLALQKVDGRPFEKAVHERVLSTLGMTSSDFVPTSVVKKNLAEALMWNYHGREFQAPTFELGEAPAGCMYSTVLDLAKFMSAMFAEGKGANGRVLKAETLKQMLSPQFEKPDAKSGFGLGFMIGDLNGLTRVGHGGAIYGFSTEVAFLPSEKLGVVVIANKDVTNRITTRLANEALSVVLAARDGKPMPKVEAPEPMTGAEARKLAGKYGTQPTHELFEASGKLYYLPPKGGFVAEVRKSGTELVLAGPLGDGSTLQCDGATLTFGRAKERTHERIAQRDMLPSDVPERFKGLLGEYGWDHNTLYIFEKDAKLYALIEWFFLYPLEEENKDTYRFPAVGGLYHGEKIVFKRDGAGRATEAIAAGVAFKRRTLDGEDGQTFRIEPQKTIEELRKLSAASQPPEEKGKFKNADLVELVALDPTIKTDLRYATDNNFMGTPLYPRTAKAYMQRPAAEALVKANKALAAKGYGLWVFDSYRPWAVTKMFWDATPEKLRTFVADPSKGSRHNRGCAVDLTLYDLKTGRPVETVSGFDEFSDRSYPNYWGGSSRQRWHRELLRHTMEDAGFSVYEAEWWHYDFKDWRSYRIGNQGFDELNR